MLPTTWPVALLFRLTKSSIEANYNRHLILHAFGDEFYLDSFASQTAAQKRDKLCDDFYVESYCFQPNDRTITLRLFVPHVSSK
jgi:hypothetical protein